MKDILRIIPVPYTLKFKHPFGISHTVRSHTDCVYHCIQSDGIIGWGESTLPPYLPETTQSVLDFIRSVNESAFRLPSNLNELHELLREIDEYAVGNLTAKAGLDIALHDWLCKKLECTLGELYRIPAQPTPPATFTIGLCDEQSRAGKVVDGAAFHVLKLKLGSPDDRAIISHIQSLTNQRICVDFNQGLSSLNEAIELCLWLEERGVELIEQPFAKQDLDKTAKLAEACRIPVIADESLQRISDLKDVLSAFDGINIKLMKCGGFAEAYQIATEAKKRNAPVLIGCMSESSCGISAALHLTPLTRWADLDGPFLLANDPFTGVHLKTGSLEIPNTSGTGAQPLPFFIDHYKTIQG